jgi:hypothetical protein
MSVVVQKALGLLFYMKNIISPQERASLAPSSYVDLLVLIEFLQSLQLNLLYLSGEKEIPLLVVELLILLFDE